MAANCGVMRLALYGFAQRSFRAVQLVFLVIDPAKAVEERTVKRFLVKSALYHVLGFIQTLVAVGKHVTVIIQNLSVFGINVQNFFELLFGSIELFLALVNCAEQKPGGFIFARLAGKHFGLFCGGFGILIAMAALVDLRNVQIYF